MSGTAGGPRQESLSQGIGPFDEFGAPLGARHVYPDFVIGPKSLIASAALPDAGAFAVGQTSLPGGTKRVTAWITYTRGAAGGFPAIRASTRPSLTSSWYRTPILDLSSFAAAAPEGRENFYQEELLGPIPADANPIRYELTFVLPANAAQFQLELAERGVPGTPGTAAVDWTGDG